MTASSVARLNRDRHKVARFIALTQARERGQLTLDTPQFQLTPSLLSAPIEQYPNKNSDQNERTSQHANSPLRADVPLKNDPESGVKCG